MLDYVEGVYNVDPSRIERSVHPKLAKIGFYRSATDPAHRAGNGMTYDGLIEVALSSCQGRLRLLEILPLTSIPVQSMFKL